MGPGRIRETLMPVPRSSRRRVVGQPFHGVLGCDVGAAEGDGGKAQHRGAIDDPAAISGPHGGKHPSHDLVRAEEVDVEDGVQGVAAEILHRGGNREGTVVEDGVEGRRLQRDSASATAPSTEDVSP